MADFQILRDFILTNGSAKWAIIWSNYFFKCYILQMINIHKIHGKYVSQVTNYTLWNGSMF